MFALIHYRPWPTSTVVSYFEQIVIRRRLEASINVIDGASRRSASPEAFLASHATSSRPFFFPPLPSLVNYSTALENNYIPSTALIAPTQTHDFGGKLLERDDGWKVWHEWSDAFHSNVYKDQEFVGRLRSFMVFESRYLTRCSLLKNINYKFSHLLLFLLHSYELIRFFSGLKMEEWKNKIVQLSGNFVLSFSSWLEWLERAKKLETWSAALSSLSPSRKNVEIIFPSFLRGLKLPRAGLCVHRLTNLKW